MAAFDNDIYCKECTYAKELTEEEGDYRCAITGADRTSEDKCNCPHERFIRDHQAGTSNRLQNIYNKTKSNINTLRNIVGSYNTILDRVYETVSFAINEDGVESEVLEELLEYLDTFMHVDNQN